MYRRYNIRAYLYFSLVFLLAVVNRILYLVSGDFPATYYSTPSKLTYYFGSAFLVIAFTEFRPRLKRYALSAFVIFLSSSEFILLSRLVPLEFVGVFDETFRVILGLIILLTAGTERYLINNIRSKAVRIILAIIGLLMIGLGIFRFNIFLSAILSQSTIPLSTYQTRDVIWTVIAVLTASLAIFVPDLFLITHSQLSYVFRLYDLVSSKTTKQTNESLVEYINSLPPEVLREVQTDSTSPR